MIGGDTGVGTQRPPNDADQSRRTLRRPQPRARSDRRGSHRRQRTGDGVVDRPANAIHGYPGRVKKKSPVSAYLRQVMNGNDATGCRRGASAFGQARNAVAHKPGSLNNPRCETAPMQCRPPLQSAKNSAAARRASLLFWDWQNSHRAQKKWHGPDRNPDRAILALGVGLIPKKTGVRSGPRGRP